MNMLVNFAKMHGLGNDFILLDLITQNVRLHTAHIKRMMDRHIGLGADQLLLIEPPLNRNSHFSYRIFNPDGSEAEQCGNGVRCAARFFFDSGLTDETYLFADSFAGTRELKIEKDNSVTVNMGDPEFNPKKIPFLVNSGHKILEILDYPLSIDNRELRISAVSLGNPHLVIIVDDLATIPLGKLGPLLSKHSFAPNEINVEFVQIVDRGNIKVRVYERGVGETLACGSGACAAVVIGQRLNLLDDSVNVAFKLGTLSVKWEGMGSNVYLQGPATSVFIGRFRL